MGKDKDKDEKKKHFSNPFNNEIQLCCDCGGCCLVHQQFTIEEDLPASQFPGTLTVFEANSYEPSCVPGQVGPCLGAAETEQTEVIITQVPLRTLPFGTVIARNIGNFAFDFTLVGTDTEEDVITKTVPPGLRSLCLVWYEESIFKLLLTLFTRYLTLIFSSFRRIRFNSTKKAPKNQAGTLSLTGFW
ncbi:hypothetical protein QE429_000543 [Bacillus sp. SORGH_AS 510]|uniref:hypothetical protein n=1 Tax=Bacillus sp. SORGH_AS_0510 TaxID=3041771 RepID=UPI00278347CD|nr:hypothetical protein [Bacillus sp. SORGH_AS_0510]MDQ1143716.1 hypothetical protein [Bacillus sp. SORGH_AS_0510]